MSKRWVNWIRQQRVAILVAGVLVRTPDHRHILLDGGWPRRNPPTGKNAADFVDWKFDWDYGDDKITLDAMICTHSDQDHYGGLWDLLNPQEDEELALTDVRVQALYHARLAWWTALGGKELGSWEETPDSNMFIRLMRDRDAVMAALPQGASPRLGGEWRGFMERATEAIRNDGTPTPIQRLSDRTGLLRDLNDRWASLRSRCSLRWSSKWAGIRPSGVSSPGKAPTPTVTVCSFAWTLAVHAFCTPGI